MVFKELPPGMSVEGESIEAHRGHLEGDRYLYLMAGVHGDEPEGIFVLEKLFRWIKGQAGLSLPLVILPVLNRDGYARGTRANARGVDLNRNLPSSGWSPKARLPKYSPGPCPLSEPENIFLDKLFKHHRPGLIITLHSWRPMLNYNGDCRDVALFLKNHNNYTVCADIEDYPTPGSLGEYAPENYGTGVLTYELPRLESGVTFQAIWEENREGLEALLSSPLLKRFF